MKTHVYPVSAAAVGKFTSKPGEYPLSDWDLTLNESIDAKRLQDAADRLKTSNTPVAFPTETVYGLGADATRSEAVKGIYNAKQRPSDNPLIVHVASMPQLSRLCPALPKVYIPLIKKFWPGPLTILLPLPDDSPLAVETTAGQKTFGVRMPRHLLALALIKLADVPVAAPSANASTKPSPTAAEHVLHDLDGRLETIIDGGPCDIGLESTVVDGLCSPPQVLRPGGLSLDDIKTCPGFEETTIAYADASQDAPRAPGMKYRHYSPKAKVILFEAGSFPNDITPYLASTTGVVRTRDGSNTQTSAPLGNTIQDMLDELSDHHQPSIETTTVSAKTVYNISIGPDDRSIARGLFSALRDLDRLGVDCILVQGIDPRQGDMAAAIMNRLRKAAS